VQNLIPDKIEGYDSEILIIVYVLKFSGTSNISALGH